MSYGKLFALFDIWGKKSTDEKNQTDFSNELSSWLAENFKNIFVRTLGKVRATCKKVLLCVENHLYDFYDNTNQQSENRKSVITIVSAKNERRLESPNIF